MFIIFKTDYLKVWFLLQKKIFELSELNTLKSRKTTSSSILLIKEWFQGNRFHSHCHLCVEEDHLKLRVHSL